MSNERFNQVVLSSILGVIVFIFGVFCGIKLSFDNYKKLNKDNFYCERSFNK